MDIITALLALLFASLVLLGSLDASEDSIRDLVKECPTAKIELSEILANRTITYFDIYMNSDLCSSNPKIDKQRGALL